MKLSAKDGHHNIDVYLDGKKLDRVLEVDDEAGYAVIYAMDSGGHPIKQVGSDTLVTERLIGKVEIQLRECGEFDAYGALCNREAGHPGGHFHAYGRELVPLDPETREWLGRERARLCAGELMRVPDCAVLPPPCERCSVPIPIGALAWHRGQDFTKEWTCSTCVPVGDYQATTPEFIGKMPERGLFEHPFKKVEVDPNSPLDLCNELDAMRSDMIAALGVPADLLKDCPPSASLKEAAQGLGNKAIDHTKIGRQRRDLDAAFSPTSIPPADSTGRNGTKLFPESVAPKCSPEYAGWASGDFKAEIAKVENEIKTQKSKLVEVEAWIIDLSYKRSALTRGLAETVKRNGGVKS